MVRALFDTNILIDFLRGVQAARDEFARYDDKAISVVTWMEVMAGAPAEAERRTRMFLDGFILVGLDGPVAERAVALRRQHRLKLPDAIVWASAQVRAMLLVTRDTKGFPADDPYWPQPFPLVAIDSYSLGETPIDCKIVIMSRGPMPCMAKLDSVSMMKGCPSARTNWDSSNWS